MRVPSLHTALLVTLLAICLLCGCREEAPPSPPAAGTVMATPAYLQHFGQPPQGKEGRAYARVGYLSLNDQPDKVRAVPLFVFDRQNELQKILARLSSGDLILPEETNLVQPFPDDLQVSVGADQTGVQVIALTAQQSWPASERSGAGLAIAETALQFAEVERVMLTLNGSPFPGMPDDGYIHDPQRIAAVPPPALVLMGLNQGHDTGADREILIEFDRPVEVQSFQLFDQSGDRVGGEYYTSIFQMAVVVRPAAPERYAEGTVLRAEWEVTDYLGRQNRGSTRMALKVHDH